MIRVGVTGHRFVDDEAGVRGRAIEVLESVRAERSAHAVEIWSALAEGADRIVADLVPAHAERLVAVLPLEAADYRDDFADPASLAHFDRLLAAAHRVEVAGPDESGTRESAYERAGLGIVEGCDVLLALWDGEPTRGQGGTADVVDVARRRGREVIVVPTRRTTP